MKTVSFCCQEVTRLVGNIDGNLLEKFSDAMISIEEKSSAVDCVVYTAEQRMPQAQVMGQKLTSAFTLDKVEMNRLNLLFAHDIEWTKHNWTQSTKCKHKLEWSKATCAFCDVSSSINSCHRNCYFDREPKYLVLIICLIQKNASIKIYISANSFLIHWTSSKVFFFYFFQTELFLELQHRQFC